MVISDESFFTLSSNRKSLVEVASLFELTEEEMNHPNCGMWIADCIKQLQVVNLTLKAIKARENENLKIENFIPDPFIQKPNPLIASDQNPMIESK